MITSIIASVLRGFLIEC